MNSNKKIVIVGCKSTTRFLLENLIDLVPVNYLVTIDQATAQKNEVADYEDLKMVCEEHSIACYQAASYALKHAADQEFFGSNRFDLAFVAGWQRLLPEAVLNTLQTGAFGMHGSAMDLPLGRGRSPMNWAILEGKGQFYTNLFKYDPGVDSGDVLDTFKFQITGRDTAETMHFKNTLAMVYLIRRNLTQLLSSDFKLRKQDPSIEPTLYPKREPADSLIDWNQDILAIERFIRAVAPPFNGAFSFIGENQIRILDAQVFDVSEFGFEYAKAGNVVQVFPNGKFLVKCYGGLLLINRFETNGGIAKGDHFSDGKCIRKIFKRNDHGNFDMKINE